MNDSQSSWWQNNIIGISSWQSVFWSARNWRRWTSPDPLIPTLKSNYSTLKERELERRRRLLLRMPIWTHISMNHLSLLWRSISLQRLVLIYKREIDIIQTSQCITEFQKQLILPKHISESLWFSGKPWGDSPGLRHARWIWCHW